MDQPRSSSIGRKLVAGIVLAIAAWLVLKVVIGIIASVSFIIAAVLLLVAVVWALRQF